MIEIRRLCAEDLIPYYKMKAVVYNRRRDCSDESAINRNLGTLVEAFDAAPWHWGVFDNGRLISGMLENEFLMRFDGNEVPMAGIGGVGTLPEARKGGLVRIMYEKFFHEAFDKGVIFSCLRPFSHAFYRKFGYEFTFTRHTLTVPAREFAHEKLRGTFTHIFPGDDFSALKEVHKTYIAPLNQSISREYWPNDRAWKIFTKDDPYASGNYLYLWRDESGKPRGYIKYNDIEKDREHTMNIRELVFTDPDALRGVMSIIGGLEAQFKKITWNMPQYLNFTDFINAGDNKDIELKVLPATMTMCRVMNVKAALQMMRRPAGEGAYVIGVEDPFISANNGRFLVEYGPGGSQVSQTQKEPDLSCDIPSLSQLIIGYRTLQNALFSRRGLEVAGNREILDRVFTIQPIHLTEDF